jgi:hypothetical protein
MKRLRVFFIVIIYYIKTLFGYTIYLKMKKDGYVDHIKITRIGFKKYQTEVVKPETAHPEIRDKALMKYHVTTYKTFNFMYRHAIRSDVFKYQ